MRDVPGQRRLELTEFTLRVLEQDRRSSATRALNRSWPGMRHGVSPAHGEARAARSSTLSRRGGCSTSSMFISVSTNDAPTTWRPLEPRTEPTRASPRYASCPSKLMAIEPSHVSDAQRTPAGPLERHAVLRHVHEVAFQRVRFQASRVRSRQPGPNPRVDSAEAGN